MSVFDWSIDRSECPRRYEYTNGVNRKFICCRLHQFETGHTLCHAVKDFECPWLLNGKVERLERIVEELIGGEQ